MSLPALRFLRSRYPEAAIHLAAKGYVEDIFTTVEGIDGTLRLPAGNGIPAMIRAVGVLKPHRFDLGILFTNSFHSALLFKLAGVGRLAGYKRDGRGFLLAHKWDFPKGNEHHIHFYADLIGKLPGPEVASGGGSEGMSGLLTVTGDEKRLMREILSKEGVETGTTWVGISPFAAFGPAKEWPWARFAALIQRIHSRFPGTRILIFGSGKEGDRAESIAGCTPGVVNLAGRLSLRQSIAAMSLCSLFISNDSGLMHVAAALACPTIALFGPTRPEKTSPLHSDVRILHKPADCAPCIHRLCPADHRCMDAIGVDEVLEAVVEMMGRVEKQKNDA